MTKEEGLSLGETAHPLKSRELRPPVASAAGNRATNKFKEFNADRMVSVQFNPSQQVKESKEPVTSKNIVGMVSGDCSDTHHTFDCLSRDGIPLSSRKH